MSEGMGFAHGSSAMEATAEARGTFIAKTYSHLAAAIMAFVLFEVAFFALAPGVAMKITELALSTRLSWIVFMGAFIGVSWMADHWARSSTSSLTQYIGLSLYVVAEAVCFVPLVAITLYFGAEAGIVEGMQVLYQAALITFVTFAGLTGFVFLTRKDFSFLRGILAVVGVGALGLVISSAVFGFTLGAVFAAAMIVFAGASILYKTSNILHHYRTDQHVAAALSLFASVALMLWYVIILLNRRR